MLVRASLLAIASLISVGSAATDISFGGAAEILLAAEPDKVVISRLEVMPELDVAGENGVRFFGSLRLRADASDRIAPDDPAYPTYADLSRPLTLGDDITADLRDFYLEYDMGDASIRLGKQQVVWGQLDGFKLLDQVNPQSFEQFILEDFSRSRIGLWSVSTEFSLGETDVQLVYAPDNSVHDIPGEDGLYAFHAPRFRFGAPVGTPSPPPGDLVNEAKAGVFAARVSRYVSGWDLAMVGLSGPDHVPLGLVTLEGSFPKLSRFYKRRTLLGASASTSFGSFVFRGEAGFMPSRHFNIRNDGALGIERSDQLTLAAALDFDAPGGLFLSAQLVYDDVLSAPEGLVRPQNDVYLSLYAQKYFRNETIKASARLYAANSLFEDGLFRAELEHILSDDLKVAAGVDLFFGDQKGIYGQFDDRDRLTVSLTRYF
ncbi:MAG: hypothetical protein HWE25_14875 [Alphaproteobacteria bacterium]|nr:hypothetical protein [Alphaproteobacteria bacterium]